MIGMKNNDNNKRVERLVKQIRAYCKSNIEISCNGYWVSKKHAKHFFGKTRMKKECKDKILDYVNNRYPKWKEGVPLINLEALIHHVFEVPIDRLLIPQEYKHYFPVEKTHYSDGLEKLVYEEDD